MAKNPFEDTIEKAWMERNDISPQTSGEIRDAIEKTLDFIRKMLFSRLIMHSVLC